MQAPKALRACFRCRQQGSSLPNPCQCSSRSTPGNTGRQDGNTWWHKIASWACISSAWSAQSQPWKAIAYSSSSNCARMIMTHNHIRTALSRPSTAQQSCTMYDKLVDFCYTDGCGQSIMGQSGLMGHGSHGDHEYEPLIHE